MSLRDFFSRRRSTIVKTRKGHKVKCEESVKKLIKEWTDNECWKFENFFDFLELVGIETPVKFSEHDEVAESFKCTKADGTEIQISLYFGDWMDFCSEIHITEGEETKAYYTNSNSSKGKGAPKVTYHGGTITKWGKELYSFYSKYFCDYELHLNAQNVLKIKIDEPRKYEDKTEICVLRNGEKIKEWLLSINDSITVEAVYEKIIEFLGFTNEDIANCEKIYISKGKDDKSSEKLYFIKGQRQ